MDITKQLELIGYNNIKIGSTVPGQQWVPMEGVFTAPDLRKLADLLEEGELNDYQNRSNDRLGLKS